jgi:hypothetical protein
MSTFSCASLYLLSSFLCDSSSDSSRSLKKSSSAASLVVELYFFNSLISFISVTLNLSRGYSLTTVQIPVKVSPNFSFVSESKRPILNNKSYSVLASI